MASLQEKQAWSLAGEAESPGVRRVAVRGCYPAQGGCPLPENEEVGMPAGGWQLLGTVPEPRRVRSASEWRIDWIANRGNEQMSNYLKLSHFWTKQY